MRVEKLTGNLLDYWTARAQYAPNTKKMESDSLIYRCLRHDERQVVAEFVKAHGVDGTYSPSTDWGQGGPIIEREDVSIDPYHSDGFYTWRASRDVSDASTRVAYGETALIAAMRCFVASKFGDSVPDE